MAISGRQLRFRRWLSRNSAGYCEIATGAKRPRNDKPLAFTVLSTACISRQHCAGRGQPGPYNGIARLGGRVEKTETYDIDGAPRCVIVIRKERPTPPAYPRRYAKIKQSPL